ncbi:PEP-CTERM sorting domain-containing protein [Pseudoduganella sp. FT55W]|uniref:PEP-CTERM sorting domain-containing protein n=1 Tax=Duganella rivi TaxID=2666083 RepID=A0A7X4GMX7_9BURK|nr:PEP-CTERM sorting domain-containing protein [Duganella rivi]MYM66348.1 PEP-CTERM sorting domain-containing protein [Duganella rivi]
MRTRRSAVRPVCPKRLSLLVAQAMLMWLAAPATEAGVIELSGNYWSDPWYATPFPAGDIYQPNVHLSVGTGGNGTFSMGQLTYASLRSLAYAVSNNGVAGSSTSTISGPGTLLELTGNEGRLTVGGFGTASLTLADGAAIHSWMSGGGCSNVNSWCGVNVAGTAGSEGTFTLTGKNTSAAFVHGIDIAHAYRDPNGSVSGGSAIGHLNVLDGAHLMSEYSYSSDSELTGWQTPGTESSHASILINGAGSAWAIGNLGSDRNAVLSLGYGERATATLDIENGGTLAIYESDIFRYSALRLGANGAHVTANVSGGGSIAMQGGTLGSNLDIGANGGFGTLNVFNGGKLSGAQYIGVGTHGGTGALLIDGSTSSATFLSGSFLDIGNAGTGRLEITGGAGLSAGVLNIGLQGGDGTVLLSGAGSRLTLSKTDNHRFNIENGSMTVSDGAVLDATADALTCLNVWCGNVIGTSAGYQASLTVTGAGSRVSVINSLDVGGAWAEIGSGYVNGTPGGISSASLTVRDGGKVESQYATVGSGPNGPSAIGTEHSFAHVLLQGTGSSWTVSGNPLNNSNAWFATNSGGSDGVGSSVDLRILAGAELIMGSTGVNTAIMKLGWQNGATTATVSGAGSRVLFASQYNELHIGSDQASATLNVTRGGRVDGVSNLVIGFNGGNGTAIFDGAGSGASGSEWKYGGIDVGVVGGHGRLQISNGAVLDFREVRNVALNVGVSYEGESSTGTLSISGAGSQLLFSSQAAPASSDAQNPWAAIGFGGVGQVSVLNGGLLSLIGQTSAETAYSTGLYLGIDINGASGTGTATVSGAGSRLQVAGVDGEIAAGMGTLGSAQVSVLNGGRIETTKFNLGLDGGHGRLLADGGTVALSGQWRNGEGASLRLGSGAGASGSAQLRNGAAITLANAGEGGVLLSVGSGGSGVLRADSGSAITLIAGAGKAVAEINGVSSMVLNASSLSAAGGSVYVGGQGGDSATLKLENNASLTADYVGVGTRYGVDGGNATLIVNGSTLTAGTLEIGALGYVGGNGTLVADIINRGVFNPGNSPGTLVIDGDFINGLGGRLVLEVESNGAGGYNIDHLLFKNGAALDFSGLKISFHFLGATDPNAFNASGLFDIDNFIDYQGAGDIDHGLYSGVSFAAESDGYTITDFRFSADGGAAFSAQPVPEPGAYAMLLAGLGLVGWRRRRKAPAPARAD